MPAGDTYDKYLNTTKGNSQTPCLYDPDVDEWMMPVRSYGHNGTIWVPIKCAADGSVNVSGITVDTLTATEVGLKGTLAEKLATDIEIITLQSKIDALTAEINALKNGEANTVDVALKGSLIEDEQAVPIRYPAMEKRYTEYDNYVLPAGACIDRSIYKDIKGFRYVNLVLWRDDTTIPVRIQLYSRGLLNDWFNNTIKDIDAGQKTVWIIDYPIIPTTWMYVKNMGDTAVTLKGIAIKART